MIPEKYRLKNTIKYPTSLIIGGLNKLGLEIADSLIEQGGYVIIVDSYSDQADEKLSAFGENSLISFLDYTAIPHLDEDIRRLDYIFYFHHESEDLNKKISTSEFLNLSNYLNASLSLAKKFNAKFLLTTSIKAHQLTLTRQDLNLEFGYGLTSSRHTVYTEMELQKYAESLTVEYFEREKLDTRIIRLGELIGDGIDLNTNTAFTQILLDAVTNNQIRLKKDGLDTEWYIHILDAAYGIIKAQFSRISTGEIYSLTYETPFTNLSVAYKIQEYDSDAREIVFIDEIDNLPPLKLYKPAPNLSTIGWIPKVDFDKAVKQSLASAKIFLLETKNPNKKQSNTLVDKIKGFLAIAETEPTISSEAGAVSRLIAERKRQDELRKQSISKVPSRRKRKKTFKEKLEDFAWSFFRELSLTVNIFKNKSPAQIVGILIVIGMLVIFYINYFSPTIALGRNLLILNPEIEKLEENLIKGDYQSSKSNLDTVAFHLEDTRKIFLRFQGIASLLSLSDQFNEVQKNLDAYTIFIDGSKNLAIGMEPFNKYLNSLQNNTTLRAATDSYISLSSSGLDYSAFFTDLNTSLPYVKDGIIKIQKSSEQIKSINYSLVPEVVADQLVPINNKINSISDSTKELGTAKYLSSLLGIDSPKTYVLFTLDNTIPSALGGYISAYTILTLNKGSIVEAVTQSTDSVQFSFNSLNENDLQVINARRFSFKTKEELSLNDLSSIKNIDEFSPIINKVFKDTFARNIDGVALINTDALNSLAMFVNKTTGKTIELNSVKFGEENLLKQLSAAQNNSLTSRSSLLAQVTAFALSNSIDLLKLNSAGFIENLTDSILSKDLVITTNGLSYQEYVVAQDFNQQNTFNTTQPIDLAFNVFDSKYIGDTKIPSVTTAIDSTINADFSLDNKLAFKFPNLASTAEVSLCLPANVADNSITVDNIPVERYVKTSVGAQKCVNLMVISETQVNLKWKTSQAGKITDNSQREITFGIFKVRGAQNTLDIKISADRTLKIASFVPEVGQVDNSFAFTNQLNADSYAKIVLIK